MNGQSWDEDPSHLTSCPVLLSAAKSARVQDIIIPWGWFKCLYFIILQFSLVVSSFGSCSSLLIFLFLWKVAQETWISACGIAFNICERELKGLPFCKTTMHLSSLEFNPALGGGEGDRKASVFRRISVYGEVMDVLNISSGSWKTCKKAFLLVALAYQWYSISSWERQGITKLWLVWDRTTAPC